jgi:hypothetical protein
MEYMDRAFQGSMSSSMATLALSESHAPRYRVLQYGHTVPFVYAAKASSIRAWAPCYRASFYPRVCSLREERMFRSHDHGKLMSDEAECVQSIVVSLLYYTSSIARFRGELHSAACGTHQVRGLASLGERLSSGALVCRCSGPPSPQHGNVPSGLYIVSEAIAKHSTCNTRRV